jgi:hypothetical protein
MDIDTHQYQLVKTFFVEHKFCGKFAFLDRWVGIGYLSAFFEGKFLRYSREKNKEKNAQKFQN